MLCPGAVIAVCGSDLFMYALYLSAVNSIATLLLTLFVGHQVGLLSSPGRPSTPVTGERSDIEVARSAALALWSCSKSKSYKMVSNQLELLPPTKKHYSVRGKSWSAWG